MTFLFILSKWSLRAKVVYSTAGGVVFPDQVSIPSVPWTSQVILESKARSKSWASVAKCSPTTTTTNECIFLPYILYPSFIYFPEALSAKSPQNSPLLLQSLLIIHFRKLSLQLENHLTSELHQLLFYCPIDIAYYTTKNHITSSWTQHSIWPSEWLGLSLPLVIAQWLLTKSCQW